MKRIAIIENEYIRDTQVFTENPDIIGKESNRENYFNDVKYPRQYIGIFEGAGEDEIRKAAAKYQGVHPDIISLVEFEAKIKCIGCPRRPMKPKTDNLRRLSGKRVREIRGFLFIRDIVYIYNNFMNDKHSGSAASGRWFP